MNPYLHDDIYQHLHDHKYNKVVNQYGSKVGVALYNSDPTMNIIIPIKDIGKHDIGLCWNFVMSDGTRTSDAYDYHNIDAIIGRGLKRDQSNVLYFHCEIYHGCSRWLMYLPPVYGFISSLWSYSCSKYKKHTLIYTYPQGLSNWVIYEFIKQKYQPSTL